MSQAQFQSRLQEILEPEVESLGFECVEVSFAIEGGRRILRVLLDSASGVTLDECAAVSRKLGAVLDASPDVDSKYYLEVSSPGINRPLTRPEHFRRFLGERAKIRLKEKQDGATTVTGILRGLSDDVLTVETTVGTKQVALGAIAKARLHRDLDRILKESSRERRKTERPVG